MTDWRLINPEGVLPEEAFIFGTRPATLEGKTVLLRWNGKHNGDVFLNRVAELFLKKVKGVKVIKNWEGAVETAETSSTPERSRKFARKLAAFKPDVVIGATAD